MKSGECMENQVVEKKNTPLFILKVIGNVIFYSVIALLLLFSIMNINGGNKTQGFPNIFGKGFLSVQSDSMKGENPDSFVRGDLLFVDVFNPKDYDSLEVGMIVTFYDDNIDNLNSHRIVYIARDDNGKILSLAVQGDFSVSLSGTYNPADPNRGSIDMDLLNRKDVVNLMADDIKGVVTGKWSGAGTALDFMRNYWLFIFVLPVLCLMLFEIFMVVKNVMALQAEKQRIANKEQTAIDMEAQKEELRKQILAEMDNEQVKEAMRAQILAELKAEEEKKKEEENK